MKSKFKEVLTKLRQRGIIATLAAFIGGGWLLVEVVERLLVGHYKFPEESIDLTVVSVVGALLATLVWRWFGSTDKRPGNIRVEILLVPLILLATVAIDLAILLRMLGIPSKTLIVAAVAICLGIAWVILKLSQWASAPSSSSVERVRAPAESLAPTLAVPDRSIVVLPFANISPEEGQEYFCDGMTEELITELSHVNELRVVSRNSAMTYKGTKKDTRTIGQELNVRYVLEGSVRKAGNSLRITAQLIDAPQDAHVWAEKYSGTLDDVFDIQEKVSRAIVDALRVRLSPSEHQRLARRSISDSDVYDDWLRARHLVRNYSTTGLAEAVAHLENGLKRIGDNPQVMAGLAYIHVHLGFLGSGMEADFDKAVYWATKALALDDGLAQAHQALGIVEGLHGRPRESLVHLKAALATEPGEWETHQWLAYFYLGVGRHAEGLIHAQAMVAIDPVEPLSTLWLLWALLYDGKTQEAVSTLDTFKIDLANPHRRLLLAWIWAWLGKRDDALGPLKSIEAPNTYEYTTQLCLLLRDALWKDRKAFQEHLTSDLVRTIQADAWGACTIAEFYCLLGDVESALPWLDRAAHWGWFNYPLYARTDPFFEPLRGDPRFKAFLERVKSQWEDFEV
jgi:TolB-like protein/TPR repeat protein